MGAARRRQWGKYVHGETVLRRSLDVATVAVREAERADVSTEVVHVALEWEPVSSLRCRPLAARGTGEAVADGITRRPLVPGTFRDEPPLDGH